MFPCCSLHNTVNPILRYLIFVAVQRLESTDDDGKKRIGSTSSLNENKESDEN
jgi:hypothetical protein